MDGVIYRGTILALILGSLLAGCGGGGGGSFPYEPPVPEQNPRPDDAPDFVLLTVSGHGGVLSAITCSSEDNVSYLNEPGEAAERLRGFLEGAGYEYEEDHYADLLYPPDEDQDGVADDPKRLGFVNLLAILDWVHLNWIADFDDPTRIILVAHSHGATWAHLAVSIRQEIPIAYLVTLDGVCFYWDCEHSEEVKEWMDGSGEQFAWDLSEPCDAFSVPGRPEKMSAKDIAFPNVKVNLEVRSSTILVSDCCPNVRLDGSRTGIFTYDSPESHSGVTLADSLSLDWVVTKLTELEGIE